MTTLTEHLEILGFEVRDRVTGFTGVVTSISFDLYGCVQAIVTPSVDATKMAERDSRWFDTKRLTVIAPKPVMEVPTFAAPPGGQKLPRYPEQP